MFVFIVTPHSLDAGFQEKIGILSDLAEEAHIQIGWAPPSSVENATEPSVGLSLLRGADAVIGDLSFERPSCYFEIGVAHGSNKPVFLIAEQGTRLHQVIGRDMVGFYSNMSEYREVAKKAFGRAAHS